MRRWWQEGERKTFSQFHFCPLRSFPLFCFRRPWLGSGGEENGEILFPVLPFLRVPFMGSAAAAAAFSLRYGRAPNIWGLRSDGCTYGCTLPSGVQLGTDGGSNCLHFWRFHCTRFTGGHSRGSNERIKKRGRGKVGSIQRELWSSPRLSIVHHSLGNFCLPRLSVYIVGTAREVHLFPPVKLEFRANYAQICVLSSNKCTTMSPANISQSGSVQ